MDVTFSLRVFMGKKPFSDLIFLRPSGFEGYQDPKKGGPGPHGTPGGVARTGGLPRRHTAHYGPKRPKKGVNLRFWVDFGPFFGVAVVGKFRSRIRLLQFSTGKITPHGNTHVSSARPPIDFFVLFVGCVFWRNQSGDRLWSDASRLTPRRRDFGVRSASGPSRSA